MFIDLNNLDSNHTILLNSISDEIRTDFNILIDLIINKTDKSIFWLVNPLISRNNYFSTLFTDLCYLELCKKLINNHELKKIIVPSTRLKNVLKKSNIIDEKTELIVSSNLFIEKLKVYKIIFKRSLNIAIYSLYLFLKSSSQRKKKILNNINSIVLIDTYITKEEIVGNKYKSRFFSNKKFWDFNNNKSKSNIFFCPEFEFSTKDILSFRLGKAFNVLNKSKINIIFKNDFLGYKDYIFALFSSFKINKIDLSNFYFRGLNVGPLLNYDYINNINNVNSFYGILNYRFFKNIRKTNISIRKIISSFENQPSDKGFCMGVNKFFSQVEFLGYQNFVSSYNYNQYLLPTVTEEKLKIIPKKILVIGKKIIPIIKKFNKNLNVILGPGLRFSHIHDDLQKNEKKNILICLPDDFNLSYKIIELCNHVIFSIKDYKILLKPHPNNDLSNILESFPIFKNNVDIVYGSIGNYLNKTKIFISSSSTVCFESIAFGIPTIIVELNSKLNRNPIPNDIDQIIWRVCYNKNDINKTINEFLKYSFDELSKLKNISSKIKNDYFEKISKKNIKILT